jgi:hypothetical protein
MSKLFVFLIAVVSIWYVMRWVQQVEAGRRVREFRSATQLRATDTVICERCGTYVPANSLTACGRRDCPFPRRG